MYGGRCSVTTKAHHLNNIIYYLPATLRYVFAAAPNCEVIHGTIYSCLRAMFGLSVIGILVSIFSCMLVYQILRWEQ